VRPCENLLQSTLGRRVEDIVGKHPDKIKQTILASIEGKSVAPRLRCVVAYEPG
jgi:hypothetical protein